MSSSKLSLAIFSLAIVATVSLSSCCCSKKATKSTANIEANKWKLTTMTGTADNLLSEGDSFTIEFLKEKNTIAGVAACNRFFGNFELKDKSSIKIKTGGSTMMACPNMNLEQPFFAMLEKADKYTIANNSLTLYSGKEKIATFKNASVDMHNAQNSLDVIGTYIGNLPAADCPGINTTLTLKNDNSYTLKMEYIDRNVKVTEKGKYAVKGNILILTPNKGNTEQYKIAENRLISLDADGNTIDVDPELAERFILTKK